MFGKYGAGNGINHSVSPLPNQCERLERLSETADGFMAYAVNVPEFPFVSFPRGTYNGFRRTSHGHGVLSYYLFTNLRLTKAPEYSLPPRRYALDITL